MRMSRGEMSAARTIMLWVERACQHCPACSFAAISCRREPGRTSSHEVLPRVRSNAADRVAKDSKELTYPFSPFRTDLTTSLTPRLRCRDLEAADEGRPHHQLSAPYSSFSASGSHGILCFQPPALQPSNPAAAPPYPPERANTDSPFLTNLSTCLPIFFPAKGLAIALTAASLTSTPSSFLAFFALGASLSTSSTASTSIAGASEEGAASSAERLVLVDFPIRAVERRGDVSLAVGGVDAKS